MTQVACAGADTPTLALTPDEDSVWQWGNTEFVKATQLQQQLQGGLLTPSAAKPSRLQALQVRS